MSIFMIFFSTGVQSQVQLVQSGAEMKKPGESVKISCKTSGLVWVGRIDPADSETKYSESFKGRFTITTDNSISTTYLQLNSLRTEDTAVYYCARHTVRRSLFKAIQLWRKEKIREREFCVKSCGKNSDTTERKRGCVCGDS
uniref:Ig-like domain-containing protein n=1 Tax=Gopherus agassizii TaxID=38772 RepID=A0A452J6Y0_9SAUR